MAAAEELRAVDGSLNEVSSVLGARSGGLLVCASFGGFEWFEQISGRRLFAR